jgi:hypothetical protein
MNNNNCESTIIINTMGYGGEYFEPPIKKNQVRLYLRADGYPREQRK